MRLLFVTTDLRVGGAERHWSILIPGLAERGFEPHFLAVREAGEFAGPLRDGGIPVQTLGAPLGTPAGWRRAAALTGAVAPAAVVSFGVLPLVLCQALAVRRRAVHVVNDHRQVGMAYSKRQRLTLRLVAPYVDRVIAITHGQVPYLRQQGFRSDRIEVIANAVDHAALGPQRSRDAVRAELRVPDDAFVALAVAQLRPEKRLGDFVEGVRRAAVAHPGLQGLIAGAGPEAARLADRIARTGAPVRLLGLRTDVADLMTSADAVCLTSRAEAVPMALLEAMAVGRATVATDVGGTREAVVPEETGLLVPPGDVDGFAAALVRLARDPELSRRLGAAALARQRERFRADVMCDRYADALRIAVRERARR